MKQFLLITILSLSLVNIVLVSLLKTFVEPFNTGIMWSPPPSRWIKISTYLDANSNEQLASLQFQIGRVRL